jgi:hypothetical protein
LTPGAIAGIVIACVLGLVVILIIVYVIASNPKKAPQASEPTVRLITSCFTSGCCFLTH